MFREVSIVLEELSTESTLVLSLNLMSSKVPL